jgi:hypothetical protein
MNTNRKGGFIKRVIIEDTPVIYPALIKELNVLCGNTSKQEKCKEIGKYAMRLQMRTNNSVYKKLFMKGNYNNGDIKNIRKMYLKRLVESNSDNFPFELALDQYKVRNISMEEKMENVLMKLKEMSKNERGAKFSSKTDMKQIVSNNSQIKEMMNKGNNINISNKKNMTNSNQNEIIDKNNKNKLNDNNNNSENNSDFENEDIQHDQSYEDEDEYINDENGDSDNNDDMNDDYSVNMDEGGEF